MRILLDMDGVLAHFELGFLQTWRRLYPDRPFVPLAQRNSFYLTHQYPTTYRRDVMAILEAPGFFANLPPIEGALAAVAALEQHDVELFICTSPLYAYEYCVTEKYGWIERHLGGRWVERLILTSDKTMVRGDILLDDKPQVMGVARPEWEHVIYDWPQNRSELGKRRLTWANWVEVLAP